VQIYNAVMNEYLESLNLIDLISEKHAVLRKEAEERWKVAGFCEMSHTEAHLLACVRRESLSITGAARILNISRQGMQKCARHLEERGFLVFEHPVGNSRDKCMILTGMGMEYCRMSDEMKQEMEKEISRLLGRETVENMKQTLKQNWLS